MRQHVVGTGRVRRLRGQQTAAEAHLWQCLRDRRLGGLKVRRQVPLGPFVADFYLPCARLTIEVDGGGHGGAADTARDVWMAAHGFAVVRFWNAEVFENLPGVLARIAEAAG